MCWVGRTSGLWIKRNYIQTCYRSHYTLPPMKKPLTSSSNPAFQAGCRKGVELVSWFLCGREENSFSLSHAEYFVRSINGGNHYFCLPNNPTSSRHLVWLYFSQTLKVGVAIGHALAREMWAPVAWVTLRAVSNVSFFFSWPQWPAMFPTVTIPSTWVLERGWRGEMLSANLEEHVA